MGWFPPPAHVQVAGGTVRNGEKCAAAKKGEGGEGGSYEVQQSARH